MSIFEFRKKAGEATFKTKAWRVGERAYACKKLPIDNPYSTSSKRYVEWLDGWNSAYKSDIQENFNWITHCFMPLLKAILH